MIIVLLTYYMNISEGKRLIKNIHNFKNVYDKGLFYSWDECKKAVHGYSGAEYKGFLTKEEAEDFLNIGAVKTATGKNFSTAATSIDSSPLTT